MTTLNDVYGAMIASEDLMSKLGRIAANIAFNNQQPTAEDMSEMLYWINIILSEIGDSPSHAIADLRRDIVNHRFVSHQDYFQARAQLSATMTIIYKLACYKVMQIEYPTLEKKLEDTFSEWSEKEVCWDGEKTLDARRYVIALKDDMMPPNMMRVDYKMNDWLETALDNLFFALRRTGDNASQVQRDILNTLILIKRNCNVD